MLWEFPNKPPHESAHFTFVPRFPILYTNTLSKWGKNKKECAYQTYLEIAVMTHVIKWECPHWWLWLWNHLNGILLMPESFADYNVLEMKEKDSGTLQCRKSNRGWEDMLVRGKVCPWGCLHWSPCLTACKGTRQHLAWDGGVGGVGCIYWFNAIHTLSTREVCYCVCYCLQEASPGVGELNPNYVSVAPCWVT